MKTFSSKNGAALFLALVLTGIVGPALHAQPVLWTFSNFAGNICGFNSLPPVTLAFDPFQNATPVDGSGALHITTDYSQSGFFDVTANSVDCCYCALEATLVASNFTSIELDVKWDTNSTVPLDFFNSNYFGGNSAGIMVLGNGVDLCSTHFVIPDAASNGWVHLSIPFARNLANVVFASLQFQKSFPSCPSGTNASFWIDNLALAGPTTAAAASTLSKSSGHFTFSFPGIRNATYTIQRSTNLIDWTTIATNYPPGGAQTTGATVSYSDTNSVVGRAYYRVQIP